MNNRQIAENIFIELSKLERPCISEYFERLKKGERGVLLLLYCNNGITAGLLKEKLGVTTARIASLLKSLEAKELVYRKKDDIDKRKVLVYITDEGLKLIESRKQYLLNIIEKITEEIGENEMRRYIELNKKIIGVLNNIKEE